MRVMKDSGIAWIGEIPEEWKIVRNKNAFVCNKELVGKKSALTQLLSLTTRGIKKKDINNAEGKLPESFDTYQFVKENDIVMCLFDLDCSAVFSGISPIDGMISPAYRVLSCKECMEPRYADYWFRYISDGRKFNHFAKNIRYTLSYEEFSALPLLLPKKVEQHRIADYLDRKCSQIDAIIARQQEVIEKLKAYKLSVITEAVTKGLNPHAPMKDSGVEWIGKIPEQWSVVPLTKQLKSIVDYRGKTPEKVDTGVFLVTAKNIKNGKIDYEISTEYVKVEDYEEIMHRGIPQIGDVLFTTEAPLGQVANVDRTDIALAQRIIKFSTNEHLNSYYLKYWIMSIGFQNFLMALSTGSTALGIKASKLFMLPITLPSIKEQQQIVTYLDNKCVSTEAAIMKKSSLIDSLIDYKKSLIYEVVTGKKEV